MKYAKIIDKGECYSTTNLVVNGVPANKFEWAKYNFYPQNDMVGELLIVNGRNVLKVTDDIYVPMSPQGIVEISHAEYLANKANNVFSGMDERQQKINDGIDGWLDLERMRNGGMNYRGALEQDAEIYYSSYKFSAGRQGEPLQYRINLLAKMLASTSIVRIPIGQAITQLLSNVKEEILREGWDLNDVDGVSWFLGLYSSAYVRALGMLAVVTEREVFVKGFIQYFNRK